MRALVIAAVAAALFALEATPAYAAQVYVSATYDLSNLSDYQTGPLLRFERLANPPAVLQEGDYVIFSLDFLGDQTLIMNEPNFLSAELLHSTTFSPHFLASGGWEFHNPSSNLEHILLINQFGPDPIEGFGAWTDANYAVTGPGPIEFSGFEVSLLVTDLLADGSFTFQSSRFDFIAASFEVGQVAPVIPGVPEPSTWAMMLVGFGATGTVVRRRRRSAKTRQLAWSVRRLSDWLSLTKRLWFDEPRLNG